MGGDGKASGKGIDAQLAAATQVSHIPVSVFRLPFAIQWHCWALILAS